MYILLSGEPPFNGENDAEILTKVKKGEYDFNSSVWDNISEDAKSLINNLLEFDPKKRIKASKALHHSWFKNQLQIKVNKKESQCLSKTLQDLGGFRIALKMQQAALTYMAKHLIKEDELKQLNKAFKILDVDNNGKLSKEELVQGYNKIKDCQLTQKELEEIFEAADADNSGEIDYSEWVLAAANKTKLLSKENLKWAFRMFDEDGSGKISYEELRSVLGGNNSKQGDKFWKDMVKEVDQNGDGEIDFDEFWYFMNIICKK